MSTSPPLQVTAGPDLEIESFRPLSQTLAWRLGQRFWHAEGTSAFTSKGVPNLATNDGNRGRAAADVLFEACAEAQRRRSLPDRIRVAEVGVGVGLHARYLLDRFREACTSAQVDYYDRIEFLATDVSRRMLQDVERCRTLDAHRGHVRFGLLDATELDVFRPLASADAEETGELFAIVHNYLLGVLPFELLSVSRAGVARVLGRTLVAGGETTLAAFKLSPERVHALLASRDPEREALLAPLVPVLRVEERLEICHPTALANGETVQRFIDAELVPHLCGREHTSLALRFSDAHGALAFFAGAARRLRPDGFVLFADFGETHVAHMLDAHHVNAFGGSTAMRVDFTWLDFAVRAAGWNVCAPPRDATAPIHSRLVRRDGSPGSVEATFQRCFDPRTLGSAGRLFGRARRAETAGNLESARECLREACRDHPHSWTVWLRAAEFEARVGGDPTTTEQLASTACKLNPSTSVAAWCELAVARERLGWKDAALACAEYAARIDPRNQRAQRLLIRLYFDLGRFDEALRAVGESFVLDRGGRRRRWLSEQQRAILAARDHALRTTEALRQRDSAPTHIAAPVRRQPLPSVAPGTSRVDRAAVDAARFLVEREHALGGWSDLSPPFGPTRVWPTILAAGALASLGEVSSVLPSIARSARFLLLSAVRGGWSFAESLGADPYTTSEAIEFLWNVGFLHQRGAASCLAMHVGSNVRRARQHPLVTAPETLAPLGLALLRCGASTETVSELRDTVLLGLREPQRLPEPRILTRWHLIACQCDFLAECGGVPTDALRCLREWRATRRRPADAVEAAGQLELDLRVCPDVADPEPLLALVDRDGGWPTSAVVRIEGRTPDAAGQTAHDDARIIGTSVSLRALMRHAARVR